jgi:protein gp37
MSEGVLSMEKPVSSVAEPELKEVVWNQMIRTEDAEVRLATEAWIEEMYRVGAVDAKRFRFPQWKAAFQT